MPDRHAVLAVILARGGSKGIPRKNIAPVDGHPLIAYTIAAALGSASIDRLVVSTDDEEIAAAARKYGAETPFRRPAELAADTTLSVDALRHAALAAEAAYGTRFDYVVELPCVAPLRDSRDVDAALSRLFETGADSVISFVETGEKHPVRMKRIAGDRITDFCREYPEPARGSRRQDFEPAYIRNGAIYAMTRRCLIDLASRHGEDSRPYVMPEERSINVDSPLDLTIARLLIEQGLCANRPRTRAAAHVERHANPGRPRVLVTAPLHFLPDVRDRMLRRTECVLAAGASREEVRALVADVDGWMCSPCPPYPIDDGLLAGAARLKVLATPSTGSSHIDADACARRGIAVLALKDSAFVNTIFASSEFTFALVLAALRKLPLAAEAGRRGIWREREDEFRGVELHGLTLGIVGYGRIGSNLARYARAFGMSVVVHDPYVTVGDPAIRQADRPDAVLAAADVVAICVHLDERTRGMVDAAWFARMRDGVTFVNTARGEVVDEAALIAALESGKVRAAAVDVVQGEQTACMSEHPMIRYARRHANLIVTPHVAGLTLQSEHKAAAITVDALERALGL
jgi:phosphoglycerate dehydrogenase-like enzyme/CMP-N-acetylneuraminic acid synthetase